MKKSNVITGLGLILLIATIMGCFPYSLDPNTIEICFGFFGFLLLIIGFFHPNRGRDDDPPDMWY